MVWTIEVPVEVTRSAQPMGFCCEGLLVPYDEWCIEDENNLSSRLMNGALKMKATSVVVASSSLSLSCEGHG